MKRSKFAIIAFFFLIQIGELILPVYKSTLAKNILEITEKERNTFAANSYVKEGIKKGKYGNYREAVHAFSQAILIDEFRSMPIRKGGLGNIRMIMKG